MECPLAQMISRPLDDIIGTYAWTQAVVHIIIPSISFVVRVMLYPPTVRSLKPRAITQLLGPSSLLKRNRNPERTRKPFLYLRSR